MRSLLDRLKYAFPLLTSRTLSFLLVSLLLYLFGNQTQVGWMFVMSALLAGTVPVAWWLNWAALRKIEIERRVGDAPGAELYEGETASVALAFRNGGRRLAAQVSVTERCPLVAPDDVHRSLNLFVPSLPPGRGAARSTYTVQLDRRGVHEFPPLELVSRAPFGFFRRRRRVSLPTCVLVYPEVRRLRHFRLLDRRLAPEIARPRAGAGTEILGVRPYRSGDSPRHIHWRSVARTGRLISKEFVDESRPGLTLCLDVCRYPYPHTVSKHTPFEWMVKIAASIGEYTQQRGYPLRLLADSNAWPAPAGGVTRLALLEYLARVQPSGERPLAEVLARSALLVSPCVAAILPWPDRKSLAPLLELKHRGLAVLAILIEPASFPAGGPSAASLAGAFRTAGLDVCLVRFGEDWREQIEPPSVDLPVNAYAHVPA